MIIKIVPSKKIETITTLIQEHVLMGSLIITDSHPSYPSETKNSFCSHQVVNHSIGFRNAQRFHTNNIKNLWSQIKYG